MLSPAENQEKPSCCFTMTLGEACFAFRAMWDYAQSISVGFYESYAKESGIALVEVVKDDMHLPPKDCLGVHSARKVVPIAGVAHHYEEKSAEECLGMGLLAMKRRACTSRYREIFQPVQNSFFLNGTTADKFNAVCNSRIDAVEIAEPESHSFIARLLLFKHKNEEGGADLENLQTETLKLFRQNDPFSPVLTEEDFDLAKLDDYLRRTEQCFGKVKAAHNTLHAA